MGKFIDFFSLKCEPATGYFEKFPKCDNARERKPIKTEVPEDSIFLSDNYRNICKSAKDPLTVNLGNAIADIRKAPHIIIAGSTGSGKSVCINNIITQLILKNNPKQLHLYIADPKKIDYMDFSDLPHVRRRETEVNAIAEMLDFINSEMYARYSTMERLKIKSVYNMPGFPAIVIIFDEYASIKDKRITALCENIARLGRAADIHLLIANQRPSRETITGTLKANCPCRICFHLPSKIDSRIVLDTGGAENLSGPGNGILLNENGYFSTFHGAMVSDEQIRKIIEYWEN